MFFSPLFYCKIVNIRNILIYSILKREPLFHTSRAVSAHPSPLVAKRRAVVVVWEIAATFVRGSEEPGRSGEADVVPLVKGLKTGFYGDWRMGRPRSLPHRIFAAKTSALSRFAHVIRAQGLARLNMARGDEERGPLLVFAARKKKFRFSRVT